MAASVLLGDMSTGHDGYAARPNIQGSPTVFAEGKPVHRVGDAWAIHCQGESCHPGVASSGSPTVFAEGKARCRVGDSISCGDSMATGASTVFLD
jgi:uncharacterized Zn-binding protein involved in type VI secretion